jgi:acetyl-CoA synthetase
MAPKLTLQQLLKVGLKAPVAVAMLRQVNQLLSSLPAYQCWPKLSRDVLTPDHPFQLHKLLHKVVFSDWDPAQGPAPAWFPSDAFIRSTNVGRLMKALNLDSYEELHAWSVQNRTDFWRLMIQRLGIRFERGFTKIVDLSKGLESPQWLPEAKLNIADSCFSGSHGAPAIVFQRVGGMLSAMTRGELGSLTNRVASGLMDAGCSPGDAIAIDMPMTPESVAIYLGIIKAGCVVVSIADSFAPQEIDKRLRSGHAKAIFTQDHITRSGKALPLYARVVAAGGPKAVVVPDAGRARATPGRVSIQLREGDVAWAEFLSDDDRFDSVPCDPSHHTNVLFSSGTTGDPKAVPWIQTTPIKCAADGYLHQDIQAGDVVAWPTNLGWMMGPWLIYASLVNQATIALFYGAPTGREFGEFVQDAGVTMLGVVPSLVAAWRDTDCMKGLDWSSIRAFSSTGECSNAEDMLFLGRRSAAASSPEQ